MVESEEVSLQATAEARERFCCSKCDREVVPQFGGQEGEFSGTSRSLTWSSYRRCLKQPCCVMGMNAPVPLNYSRRDVCDSRVTVV